MNESVEALKERLQYLENVAASNDSAKSLSAQVDDLEKTINEFFQAQPQAVSTSEKLNETGLWKDIEELWKPVVPTPSGDYDRNVTIEQKDTMVRARLDTLESVFASLETANSLELPSTLRSRDLAILKEKLPYIQTKIDEIVEAVEELSIRTAQMCKSWAHHINNQNQAWLDFDDRMSACEAALKQIEGQAKQAADSQNRY